MKPMNKEELQKQLKEIEESEENQTRAKVKAKLIKSEYWFDSYREKELFHILEIKDGVVKMNRITFTPESKGVFIGAKTEELSLLYWYGVEYLIPYDERAAEAQIDEWLNKAKRIAMGEK